MITFESIKSSSKDIDFYNLVSNKNMIKKSLKTEKNENYIKQNLFLKQNNIEYNYGQYYNYRFSQYNDNNKLIYIYYDYIEKELTFEKILNKSIYEMLVPIDCLMNNRHNFDVYLDAFVNKIQDLYTEDTINQLINNYTFDKFNDVEIENSALMFKLLEDSDINLFFEEYANIKSKNIIFNGIKLKISDIYFSNDDKDRISKYVFDYLKKEHNIPRYFSHMKKFVSKENMIFIVNNVILTPYIDAVKEKDLFFINNNIVFLEQIIKNFRVFSDKNVKKNYELLIDNLIELNNVQSNYLLSLLDSNVLLSSTSRQIKLKNYNYDFLVKDINLNIHYDYSVIMNLATNIIFDSGEIILTNIIKSLKHSEINFFYYPKKILFTNNCYNNIKNLLESIDNICNDKCIHQEISKINLDKAYDCPTSLFDFNSPYSLIIKEKKA